MVWCRFVRRSIRDFRVTSPAVNRMYNIHYIKRKYSRFTCYWWSSELYLAPILKVFEAWNGVFLIKLCDQWSNRNQVQQFHRICPFHISAVPSWASKLSKPRSNTMLRTTNNRWIYIIILQDKAGKLRADQMKRTLAEGTSSDHLMFHNAYQGWLKAKSKGDAERYCERHYLSQDNLGVSCSKS